MLRRRSRWQFGVVLAALIPVLGGCAALRKSDVDSQEQLLSAAGFQMKLADSPEKLAHLQTLTPQKLVPHTRDGKLYYAYADAEFCKCLYVGDEQAYQKYQQLAAQQRSAQDELNADAWDATGPLPPTGLWGW